MEITYLKVITPCHTLYSSIRSLWLMFQISSFFSTEGKHYKTWSRIKPCHLETSSSLCIIRGLHSPCLSTPEKLWVSLANIRLQAPAVFQVNERSIMHATCWLQAGSFAYQFSIAQGTTAVLIALSQRYLQLVPYSFEHNPLTCWPLAV